MFKANTKVALLIPLIFLLAYSCNETIEDPAVFYIQIIENKSDLNLLLVTSVSTNLDSVIIPADDEYILLKVITIGSIRGFQDCETDDLGELSIEVDSSDSLIVNIDPNESSNWQFLIFEEASNGGGTGECRLVIDDQNVE